MLYKCTCVRISITMFQGSPNNSQLFVCLVVFFRKATKRKWAHKTKIRQEHRMKNYRRFIRVFECYSFNSILDYRKIIKILPKCCFFKIWFWIGQYDSFHTIINKFYFVFKEFCCLWVLSPRIWNVLWMRFSKMNLLHQLKKWRDDPEIPKKLFFCFIFGLKIC